jgi:hypothetical protein
VAEPSQIEKQIEATKRLLAVHKQRHAQRLAAGDDDAAVSELSTILKLELRIEQLERFQRLRELTRDA